jgi:hypothetical protein
MRAVAVVLAMACHGEGAPDPASEGDADTDADSDTDADTDADTDLPPSNFPASCTLAADNALRATCTASFGAPETLVITLALGDEAPVVFTAAAAASDPVLPVWGLLSDSRWQWTATSREDPSRFATGWLDTGGLPLTLEQVAIAVDEGGDHGPESVLLNYGCNGFQEALIAIDRAGRVRWYQEPTALPVYPTPISYRSFNVGPEGGVVALAERSAFVRWSLDGRVEQLFAQLTDFDQPVHHEATRKNGLDYFLFAEETLVDGEPYVTDGFYVFDDAGAKVAEWHMNEHVVPGPGGSSGGSYWTGPFPSALDWSHSNSLAVDDDGTVTISLRFQNALMRVVGDPAAADFGRVVWTVVGDPESALTSTVPYLSSAGIADLGFSDQHDVQASGPGELTLWDNGTDPSAGSRAIRFVATDEALDLVEEWPAGTFCPGQGSATLLPSGNVLVDCAPADTIAEITPAGATVWSATMTCAFGLMLRPLYRALPIDLFPGAP